MSRRVDRKVLEAFSLSSIRDCVAVWLPSPVRLGVFVRSFSDAASRIIGVRWRRDIAESDSDAALLVRSDGAAVLPRRSSPVSRHCGLWSLPHRRRSDTTSVVTARTRRLLVLAGAVCRLSHRQVTSWADPTNRSRLLYHKHKPIMSPCTSTVHQ